MRRPKRNARATGYIKGVPPKLIAASNSWNGYIWSRKIHPGLITKSTKGKIQIKHPWRIHIHAIHAWLLGLHFSTGSMANHRVLCRPPGCSSADSVAHGGTWRRSLRQAQLSQGGQGLRQQAQWMMNEAQLMVHQHIWSGWYEMSSGQ